MTSTLPRKWWKPPLQRAPGRLQGDVSVEADVLRLFDAVQDVFGPASAPVNNAGILETQARLEQISVERLQHVLNTNVVGVFLCVREAVRQMATRQGGRGGTIVNVSGRAAVLGAPREYLDYALSKGAIDTLTIGLAKEVAAEGIRVNAVRPGIIDTDIHASGGEPGRVERLGPAQPLGRGGTLEEVAQAMLWLLSDAASYVMGSFTDVAGGR